MIVLAQAVDRGLPWFVFVPSLVMLGFVVVTAPVWRYSRAASSAPTSTAAAAPTGCA